MSAGWAARRHGRRARARGVPDLAAAAATADAPGGAGWCAELAGHPGRGGHGPACLDLLGGADRRDHLPELRYLDRARLAPGTAVLGPGAWKDYWVRTWGARGLLHVWSTSAGAAVVAGSSTSTGGRPRCASRSPPGATSAGPVRAPRGCSATSCRGCARRRCARSPSRATPSTSRRAGPVGRRARGRRAGPGGPSPRWPRGQDLAEPARSGPTGSSVEEGRHVLARVIDPRRPRGGSPGARLCSRSSSSPATSASSGGFLPEHLAGVGVPGVTPPPTRRGRTCAIVRHPVAGLVDLGARRGGSPGRGGVLAPARSPAPPRRGRVLAEPLARVGAGLARGVARSSSCRSSSWSCDRPRRRGRPSATSRPPLGRCPRIARTAQRVDGRHVGVAGAGDGVARDGSSSAARSSR